MFSKKYFQLTIILSFCLILQAMSFPPEMINRLKSTHAPCEKETHVDQADIDRANAGDRIDSRSFRCYVKCKLSADKMMTSSGDILMANIEKIYPKEYINTIRDALENCITSSKKETDLCDRGAEFAYCFHLIDPETMVLY